MAIQLEREAVKSDGVRRIRANSGLPANTTGDSGNERSIGAILVDAGLLRLEDAESVMRLQKAGGLRFGEAAVQLGFVTEENIRFALSRQFEYPVVMPGQSKLAAELVAAYQPNSFQVETLRAVRSQLMLRWFGEEPERHALTVVSAESGVGRSYVAANLAVVFSQLGEHTLLIDADMRRPRQHELFGLENRQGLSTVLSGRGNADAIQRIDDLMDLSVLPSGPIPPNPQELLSKPFFAHLLSELSAEFDVILIDSPPAEAYADAQTLSVRSGASLLVARANKTRLRTLRQLAANFQSQSAEVVGTVLNEF